MKLALSQNEKFIANEICFAVKRDVLVVTKLCLFIANEIYFIIKREVLVVTKLCLLIANDISHKMKSFVCHEKTKFRSL